MKSYDDCGKIHQTIFGAVLGKLAKKADDFGGNQMPGYGETINENAHLNEPLYDAVTGRYEVCPPENDTAAAHYQ